MPGLTPQKTKQNKKRVELRDLGTGILVVMPMKDAGPAEESCFCRFLLPNTDKPINRPKYASADDNCVVRGRVRGAALKIGKRAGLCGNQETDTSSCFSLCGPSLWSFVNSGEVKALGSPINLWLIGFIQWAREPYAYVWSARGYLHLGIIQRGEKKKKSPAVTHCNTQSYIFPLKYKFNSASHHYTIAASL